MDRWKDQADKLKKRVKDMEDENEDLVEKNQALKKEKSYLES